MYLIKSKVNTGYKIQAKVTKEKGFILSYGTIFPRLKQIEKEGLVYSKKVKDPHSPGTVEYYLTSIGETMMKDVDRLFPPGLKSA